tara:strand:+ start:262 stop:471 length:210 start_codon:yes stop_codon:yes gene_type:complete
MTCECCIDMGIITAEFIEAKVSIYAGKINLKLNDGSYFFKERVENEGYEDCSNGDIISFCPTCEVRGDI